MDIVLEVFNAVLLAIMFGVLCTWIYFVGYISHSFSKSPKLGGKVQSNATPRVNLIVPARNEEHFIGNCLQSILNQDYPNYNIIAIDDSSTDRTAQQIKHYAERNKKILFADAGPKPDGWAGKNWACYQGYLKSDADLLLFTDADSQYSESLISLAVSHVIGEGLDALTLVPKLTCIDPWTRITLPLLSTFLHSRYSPLRVNDPAHGIGYFFGSFYMIRRNVYEAIGTHSGVRNELVEDGALGSKVKKNGFKLKMFRGEHLFSAIWARDFSSLWNGLGRLIIPLYAVNKFNAFAIFLVSFFLFLAPFLVLPYSSLFMENSITMKTLFAVSITACSLITAAGMFEARAGLKINPLYGLASPLAAAVIALGFLSGILKAGRKKGVQWRGRDYVYSLYSSEGFKL
jgi:glycosyltransferase involved in cell wall biosynthesis